MKQRSEEDGTSSTAPTEASTKRRLRSWKSEPEGIVSTETFVYSPLPSANSIRLLALQSFSHEYPRRVCCTLRIHRFSCAAQHSLTYTALSYVWGKAEYLQPIQLDNVQVMVRTNLYRALLELSRDSSRPLLWVDALCINQADINERNAQVAIMKDIYSNATQVIVWLGRGKREDSVCDHGLPITHTEGKSAPLETCVSSDEEGFTSSFYDCTDHDVDEWFHRCWTLQELMLAKKAMVRCGPYVISWERLSMLMEEVCRKEWMGIPGVLCAQEYWRIKERAESVLRLQDLAQIFRIGQLMLSQTLLESLQRRSSEPVDMVFSVMGLFPEPPVAIDYSDHPEKVCKVATLACIVREKTLDIFDFVENPHHGYNILERERELAPPRYPSWALTLPGIYGIARVKPTKFRQATSQLLFENESVQDELIAQIISKPDIAVLPLTGHLLGRLTKAKGEDYKFWLNPIPSCVVTATTMSRSAAETTVSPTCKGSDTFSPSLHLLQRHDERSCDCPKAPSRILRKFYHKLLHLPQCHDERSCDCPKAPSRISGSFYHNFPSNGDWLCRIKGGHGLYLLRPASTGDLRLISVMKSRFVENLLSKIPEVKRKSEESFPQYIVSRFTAGGWPTLEVDLPLA